MASWATWAGSALAAVALLWYVILWYVCYIGWSVAKRHFREPWPRSPLASASQPDTDAEVPGVSILRPLAGLDCHLFANLCSSFEQQYPRDRFEVILSVRSESDQALSVARQVIARYPHIHSQILVGDADAGVNPKINNLVRSYAAAVHDIVWVVDSQVSLGPQAMARAVDAMTMPPTRPLPLWLNREPHSERVGLVHHVPLGVLPADTWASHVERVFLSTTHAKMYLAINAVAVDSCVMGKSNMYRKSDLDQVPDAFFHYERHGDGIGSKAFEDAPTGTDDVVRHGARALARFGIYLAEDNMLALSLWRPPQQLAHRVAPGDVAHVAVGDIQTMTEYAKRRMRWIRVRRHMVPAATR
ncbi:ceramide glucosyltransferase [Malassezia equina]|uniref:Ceramide glucosyltransferase n=1 Tax=Malassezia equina TaxID=1381935 RepID=A0AAF0IZW9_9BASI|nr:ceramide glucosyltransferase [Malassezia equina]